MASGHVSKRRIEKAGHMAAPTSRASPPKSSCQQGAVHTWHQTDVLNQRSYVCCWGESGRIPAPHLLPLMTQSGSYRGGRVRPISGGMLPFCTRQKADISLVLNLKIRC